MGLTALSETAPAVELNTRPFQGMSELSAVSAFLKETRQPLLPILERWQEALRQRLRNSPWSQER
jgi:hypothetical protein